MRLDKVHSDHIYVFVLLDDNDKPVEYSFSRGNWAVFDRQNERRQHGH